MSEIRYKGKIFSGAAAFGSADDVSYDNSESGLTSTTVQDALDEIADGGGSTGCVELTQAEYDALTDEEQLADVIYLITDSPDNYLDEVFGDFATVEYTDMASKSYAVGDYLVYDSKFYKVTTAIAQGGTIVPDTNVEQTTVGDEVNELDNKTKAIGLNTTSSMTLQQGLEAAWVSDIPADSKPHLVYVPAYGGALFGTLNRYASGSASYGSGLLTRYDGFSYKASLNNNVVSLKSLQEYITPVHTTKSPNNLTLAAHAGASFEVTVTPPAGKSLIAHVAVWGTGGVGVLTNLDGYSTSNTIRPYIINTNNSSVTLGAAYVVHVLSLYA